MSTTAERLQSELANLSEADRAELAHFLIQSLHHEAEADAERAWDIELERRGQQIKGGRAAGEPAEKVFSELRAKYS
jgi:putative addiction module component (TIGR02574 family)